MKPINIIFEKIIQSRAYEFASQAIMRSSGYTVQDLINESYLVLPSIMQAWNPHKEVRSSLSSWIWLNLGWHFNGLKRQLDPFAIDMNNLSLFNDIEDSFHEKENFFFSKETDALFEDVFDLKTDFDSIQNRIEERKSKEEMLEIFETKIKSIRKMLTKEEQRILEAITSCSSYVDASEMVGKSAQNFSYHKQKLVEKISLLLEDNSDKFQKNSKEAILLCKKLTRLGWTSEEIAEEVSASVELVEKYINMYDLGMLD